MANALTPEQVRNNILEAEHLERQSIRLSYRARALLTAVQEICPHPEVRKEDKYYPGGYDFLSTVVISEYCKDCGKLLKYYDDPEHRGTHG
jgi:hypothetical protein